MTSDREVARRALACLDLTDLGDSCSDDDVERLCSRAVTPYGAVAAVCVWPRFVGASVEHLTGTGVGVATVVNFPSGSEPIDSVLATTRRALDDGATDIDLVLPYRSFVRGEIAFVREFVVAVRDVVPSDRHLKVILETGEIVDRDLIGSAARLVIDAGADFVKTSTGKSPISATPDAVRTILTVIRDSGRRVGVKPSGGIRTLEDARRYLDLADEIMGPDWVSPRTFRFGASGLLDAIHSALGVT